MSSRGRGRGRPQRPASPIAATLETGNYDGDKDIAVESQYGDVSMEDAQAGPSSLASTSFNSSLRAGSVAPGTSSGGPTLLRRNVYAGTGKMKFTPNMVRRKVKTEDDVKTEEVDPYISLRDPSARGRGQGRGRGRGRGGADVSDRDRMEAQMTASGAFAFGPAVSEREPKKRSLARVGEGSYARAGGATESGTSKGPAPISSTALLIDSDAEEDGIPNSYGGRDKLKTVDLYDIGAEGEMAPLVMPKDEKKWQEEETLRLEYAKAMEKLSLTHKGTSAKAAESGTPQPARVKTDPYEEDEMNAASLSGTPRSASIASRSLSRAQTIDSTTHSSDIEVLQDLIPPIPSDEAAATLGAEQIQIHIKKEDISVHFNLQPTEEDPSPERFHIFQFPRLFPQFYDPADPVQVDQYNPAGAAKREPGTAESSAATLGSNAAAAVVTGELGSAKNRIKSALHESESEAWRTYEPGKWQGWGRNPGQEERETLAGNPSAEGRIGQIKVRKSGRTTMTLGNIDYEIQPGAPLSFLQELAVLDVKDAENPGLYVMGQPHNKFIVAPELSKLLKLGIEEQRVAERLRKEQEVKMRRIKVEEREAATAAALKKANAKAAAAAKKPLPPTGRGRGRPPAASAGTPGPPKK